MRSGTGRAQEVTLNQSIQILDGFEYDDVRGELKVLAIAGGQMLDCYIRDVSSGDAKDFYTKFHFDIEESLIELIESEKWNENGEVELSAREMDNYK